MHIYRCLYILYIQSNPILPPAPRPHSGHRLNAAIQDVIMQDDPSKVQALLSELPRTPGSRHVDDIIRNRPELSIKELRHRISECNVQITAQNAREAAVAKEAKEAATPSK